MKILKILSNGQHPKLTNLISETQHLRQRRAKLLPKLNFTRDLKPLTLIAMMYFRLMNGMSLLRDIKQDEKQEEKSSQKKLTNNQRHFGIQQIQIKRNKVKKKRGSQWPKLKQLSSSAVITSKRMFLAQIVVEGKQK